MSPTAKDSPDKDSSTKATTGRESAPPAYVVEDVPTKLAAAIVNFADGSRRQAALDAAFAIAGPSAEEEQWRYGPIADLDLAAFSPQQDEPPGSADSSSLSGRAASVQIVNGWVTNIDIDTGWESKGLIVRTSADTARREISVPDAGRLDYLHLALAPDALEILVPKGLAVTEPIWVSNSFTSFETTPTLSCPHLTIAVEANAEVTVIEHQNSVEEPLVSGEAISALILPLVELSVASAGRLNHITVQELPADAWQLARLVSSAADQSSLMSGFAAFGGKYARLRTDSSLDGRGANGDLVALYYGDSDQIHDFRTFQHHRGEDTTSNLLFKGALDDKAGSIYTGLIEIHEGGRGSNAHQTNRNVKLSDDAWAWSVPNLEIHNNDVRCSHASTVSPLDPDQRFYLHARGVPPTVADRLIVAGFFDEPRQRLTNRAVQELVSQLIEHKLENQQIAQSMKSGAK